jgi:hypothetical protein
MHGGSFSVLSVFQCIALFSLTKRGSQYLFSIQRDHAFSTETFSLQSKDCLQTRLMVVMPGKHRVVTTSDSLSLGPLSTFKICLYYSGKAKAQEISFMSALLSLART